MKIDKRTGRGCALSIASKTVARRLVDDGIVGKVIARKFLKFRRESIRIAAFGTGLEDIYVVLRKGVGATEQPLWTPTFIEPAIWQQAASQFWPGERLDRCVEKYLLPEMEDYLQKPNRFDAGFYGAGVPPGPRCRQQTYPPVPWNHILLHRE